MKTYKLTIFGHAHEYESDPWGCGLSSLDTDHKICKVLKEKILEPTVLSYVGLDTISFFVSGDPRDISWHMVREIEQLAMKITHRPLIREALLECSTDLTPAGRSKMFRDIRLNSCITDPITEMLDQYIFEFEELRKEIEQTIEREKLERNERKKKWREIRRYTFIRPSGGENGNDGYLDAEYESQDGSIVRMVSRDVFDFGCYSYPKKVEGTDDVFHSENWTKPESDLMGWLCEFGPFSGIRM